MKKDNLNDFIITACKKSKFVQILTTDNNIVFAEKFIKATATPRGVFALEFKLAYVIDSGSGRGDVFNPYVIPLRYIDDIEFLFN